MHYPVPALIELYEESICIGSHRERRVMRGKAEKGPSFYVKITTREFLQVLIFL